MERRTVRIGVIKSKQGPGRPAVGPAIIIRLPKILIAQLDERAKRKGVSRAEMVRQLLNIGLA